MKKVIVFYGSGGTNVYTDVERDANEWLECHPEAKILDSHTNMAAGVNPDWTEFCLALIVELPEEGAA